MYYVQLLYISHCHKLSNTNQFYPVAFQGKRKRYRRIHLYYFYCENNIMTTPFPCQKNTLRSFGIYEIKRLQINGTAKSDWDCQFFIANHKWTMISSV